MGSIGYYTGDLEDIASIDFLKNDSEKLNTYYNMGLRSYCNSSLSMIEMARESVSKTLTQTTVAMADIDVVLYIAESSERDETINSTQVVELMNHFNIKNAYPIGLCLSSCANVLMGLCVGQSMIQSGQAANILLICTDKPNHKSNGRKMNPEVAVRSDAAVSFIISNQAGDYEVLESRVKRNSISLAALTPLDFSMQKLQDIRKISTDMLEYLNLKPDDFSRSLVNNYAGLSSVFVKNCGFDADQGHYENVSKYSHCMAGDTLINLNDIDITLNARDNIYMMADGPYGIASIILQKCSS